MDGTIDRVRGVAAGESPSGIADLREDVLLSSVRHLSNEPAGARLFGVLLGRAGDVPAFAAACREIVAATRDPGVMAEIEAILAAGSSVPVAMERDLWNAFVARSRDRSLHPYVRGHALACALFLSQSSPALLRRLQAELLDTGPDDGQPYLRLAAKVIGTLLAHVRDDELETHLVTLADAEDAGDEACMELGHAALRRALQESHRAQATAGFRQALAWFGKARSKAEARPDADLYVACLEMLLNFQDGSRGDDIAQRIDRIRAASFACAAYLVPSDRPSATRSWMGSAATERVHWTLLGAQLGRLDMSLLEPAWLEAVRVIEQELLVIHAAGRTLFGRTEDGGLEATLRPRLAQAMVEERGRLHLLDRWIEANTGSEWLADAAGLRDQARAALEGSLLRNPPEAADATAASAAILAGSGLPEERKAEALSFMAMMREADLSGADPIVCEIVDGLRAGLLKNVDFRTKETARVLFVEMLYYTARFIDSRSNLQRGQVAGTDYLFDRDMSRQPPETDLQSDYFGFLQATPLARLCDREVVNVGSGRVDVLFRRDGHRIVAELKKDPDGRSLEGVVDAHGLQVAAYQHSSVTIGLLLVLDLSDRGGGSPHLREQVRLVRRIPGFGMTEYSIAVLRVQGRRLSPSKVR